MRCPVMSNHYAISPMGLKGSLVNVFNELKCFDSTSENERKAMGRLTSDQ